MTASETRRLLLLFPDDPAFLSVLFPDHSRRDLCLGDRLPPGMSNPSLLWDIAQSYAHSRHPLPDVDLPEDLIRAYSYLTDPDSADEPMALAHMLHLPDNALEGDLIDAALMGEDLSLDEIAELFALPGEVIRLKDQVFFNFRDRRCELLYVTHLSESISKANSPGAEIKRLALTTRRARPALAAAGILPAEELKLPVETLSEQIEAELLRLACRGLRKGMVGPVANPALALFGKFLLPLRQKEKDQAPFYGLEFNREDLSVLDSDLGERLELLRSRGKDEGAAADELKTLHASQTRAP
jgi:hypothetical protein